MPRMTESIRALPLLVFAAITPATVALLLLCCFAPDSVISYARAIWHATGLHFPYGAGFFAIVPSGFGVSYN